MFVANLLQAACIRAFMPIVVIVVVNSNASTLIPRVYLLLFYVYQ